MARVTQRSWSAYERWSWEISRYFRVLTRKYGWCWIPIIACGFITVCALVVAAWQTKVLSSLHQRGVPSEMKQRIGQATPVEQARARLRDFDGYLLAHNEIPNVIGKMVALANANGLLLEKGDYQAQPDFQGRFMRYRMTLPVKGRAEAIHNFVLNSLQTHRTLALESVQFKRRHIQTGHVEARIRWVLLTRLPDSAPIHRAEGNR